ncbi:MAG: serine--tRNA ligase [Candidatus Aminicenantes bacterium]
MLDPKFIENHPDLVTEKMKSRGLDVDLTGFLKISGEKKSYLSRIEKLRHELNTNSKEIGRLKKEGEDASQLISRMKEVSDQIKELETEHKNLENDLKDILLGIPNIPHDSVPEGRTEADNPEIRRIGARPEFDFKPKPHWEIGTDLGILDFEKAAKLAGARFAVYLDAGAKMERALIHFMMDIHTRENGYREVLPPFIANQESLTGTGNLPKFEDDLFKLQGTDWYLIPTAEVPLTNLYRDEILAGDDLPRRFVAYTPCFRSEAGSYGKDIRGLIRQHQFNKVEMMCFVRPEDSYDELERLTSHAETVLQRLELHYRVIELCTADLGFAGAKTYDLEIWMPARNGYVEISSCTNCEDFQARRAGIRFKRGRKSKTEYVHTLNGSGVAVGRTVSAILECFQQKDGSVVIPEALRPYMHGLEVIRAR